jgi:hypothetical protein
MIDTQAMEMIVAVLADEHKKCDEKAIQFYPN